jgi:hypothetical protein
MTTKALRVTTSTADTEQTSTDHHRRLSKHHRIPRAVRLLLEQVVEVPYERERDQRESAKGDESTTNSHLGKSAPFSLSRLSPQTSIFMRPGSFGSLP